MKLLDSALSLAAPLDCISCGEEGAVACGPCLASLASVPSRCFRCFAASSDYKVCDACRRYTPLRHVWVAGNYDGVLKELIRVYKYERLLSAYRPIAGMMGQTLPIVNDMIVVAVPTATSRRRQRGYDHALLLAKDVSYMKRLILVSPVVRTSQSRQVGATRKERFEQLKNSFIIHKPEQIKGKKVLLIDDVITTGATMETVARLLKSAGARQVNALVCAQKL